MALLALLVVLPAAPASASAAAAPTAMFGVGDWAWPTAATLDREADAGVRVWRVPLDFAAIGRKPGVLDWSGVDQLVSAMAARRIRPLFVVTGCPQRVCSGGATVPLSAGEIDTFARFVAAGVKRYGPGGYFWWSHPEWDGISARYWQIMNEVNGAEAWPAPDPAAYARLLVATSRAAKAVDPAVRIVSAGLGGVMTISLKDYLAALYRQPGFAAAVDIVGIHGYATDPAGTARLLDRARAILIKAGDSDTPLWMTEFAWATDGLAGDPFVVDEARQAAYLRAVGDLAIGCADRWNLRRVFWYGWRDARPAGDGYWGYHDGLLQYDGAAKPALAAYDEFTGSGELGGARGAACPLPGGDTLDVTAPDTTITSGPGVRTADARPAYAFTSSEPAAHFQCSVDGAAWATCTLDASGEWRPAADYGDGEHVLRVRAVDAQGNVDPTPPSWTTIYDQYPPDTYLAGTWGAVTRLLQQLTPSANEPVARYECSVDGAAWLTCPAPLAITLPLGSHTIAVRAVDLAGNTDPDPAVAWYVVSAAVG